MPDKNLAGVATRLPHIAARLFEEPLLVHPRKLQTIVHVLSPRLFADMENTGAALEMMQDPFLANHPAPINPGQSSIAVIPVHGTLVQRGDCMDALSGLRSYEAIRAEFDEVMARADIDAVLFDIDSGGGEAAGVFDLTDYVFSRRGEKPIYAFANEHAYSAAYALASTADKIFLPRTGGVGSIGVVAVHLDQSGFNEKTGLQYTPIYAGARKIDGWPHAPLSETAQSRMQARVDTVYSVFTQSVAKYRGLSESKVVSTQADCFDGAVAVEAGLADGIAAFDEVIEIILADIEQRQVSGQTARKSHSGLSGETPPQGNETMTLKNLVLGRKNRAVKTQEPSETEKPEKDPIENEEELENENAGDPQAEDDIDDIEDEDNEENLDDEDDDEEKPAAVQSRKDERKEALEIMALCKLYGKPGLAESYLRKGYSAGQVRKHLLAKRNRQLKESANTTVISNRQSARAHSGTGGVVAAVKNKLGMKE